MLTKYIAADLHRFGLNKHAFLSDDYWTNDEKKATLYDTGDFAYKMAEFAGACQPHCVKVQFNWNN